MDNLVLACPMCNYHKSAHVLGVDDEGLDDGQLFHPRIDRWEEHLAARCQIRQKLTRRSMRFVKL